MLFNMGFFGWFKDSVCLLKASFWALTLWESWEELKEEGQSSSSSHWALLPAHGRAGRSANRFRRGWFWPLIWTGKGGDQECDAAPYHSRWTGSRPEHRVILAATTHKRLIKESKVRNKVLLLPLEHLQVVEKIKLDATFRLEKSCVLFRSAYTLH